MSVQYFRFSTRNKAVPQRSALLEQLIARAEVPRVVRDWRADAFGVIAVPGSDMPAIAAVALHAEAGAALHATVGAAEGQWVCIAAPVHYLADMSSVRLAGDGILSLSAQESEYLARDFNRVWLDAGIRLAAGASGRLFCIFDRALTVTTRDPEEVLEQRIEEYLPGGADAKVLRKLMSEIEMWLFDHAHNKQRAARNLPAMNGLWLWGGGSPLSSPPAIRGFCAGDDVFFNALANSGSGRMSDAGVIAVAQAPGSDAWPHIESRWLEPALAALRAGRLARLELSAAERSFSVTSRGRFRFWRRRRPWWESFA